MIHRVPKQSPHSLWLIFILVLPAVLIGLAVVFTSLGIILLLLYHASNAHPASIRVLSPLFIVSGLIMLAIGIGLFISRKQNNDYAKANKKRKYLINAAATDTAINKTQKKANKACKKTGKKRHISGTSIGGRPTDRPFDAAPEMSLAERIKQRRRDAHAQRKVTEYMEKPDDIPLEIKEPDDIIIQPQLL